MDAAGGDGFRRTVRDPLEIDRRRSGEVLRIAPGRERHEVHGDSRCEPHREEEAKKHSPPAMQPDQDAHGKVSLTILLKRRAQKFWAPRAAPGRASPDRTTGHTRCW